MSNPYVHANAHPADGRVFLGKTFLRRAQHSLDRLPPLHLQVAPCLLPSLLDIGTSWKTQLIRAQSESPDDHEHEVHEIASCIQTES